MLRNLKLFRGNGPAIQGLREQKGDAMRAPAQKFWRNIPRQPAASTAKFYIVVPTFNAGAYLDSLLGSVLMQSGDFHLHIHVQDGGSTDNTREVFNVWSNWVAQRGMTSPARTMTFQSEKDDGLYDAVSRAAVKIDGPDDMLMTWIGADDMLMPGALATVASIFAQLRVSWVTGTPRVANERGETFTPWPDPIYTQYHLSAGHHDGRKLKFVMQEGTFWRFDLWQQAGGLTSGFRLAGDWDLWRRFAQHEPLYAVTFPLASFSRRAGQASADTGGYHAEVDRIGYTSPACDVVRSYHLERYPWAEEWRVAGYDHGAPLV